MPDPTLFEVCAKLQLRRVNFSRWINFDLSLANVIVALDLLTNPNKPDVCLLTDCTQGEMPVIYSEGVSHRIHVDVVKTLKSLGLIMLEVNDPVGQEFWVATGAATGVFADLLQSHDLMHAGDTDTIIPGVYQHFKSSSMRYNVLWTSRNTETGALIVEYQPLHVGDGGVHNRQFMHDHRTLANFTEVVYRPELNYLGPRFTLVHSHARAKIAPFK